MHINYGHDCAHGALKSCDKRGLTLPQYHVSIFTLIWDRRISCVAIYLYITVYFGYSLIYCKHTKPYFAFLICQPRLNVPFVRILSIFLKINYIRSVIARSHEYVSHVGEKLPCIRYKMPIFFLAVFAAHYVGKYTRIYSLYLHIWI